MSGLVITPKLVVAPGFDEPEVELEEDVELEAEAVEVELDSAQISVENVELRVRG